MSAKPNPWSPWTPAKYEIHHVVAIQAEPKAQLMSSSNRQ